MSSHIQQSSEQRFPRIIHQTWKRNYDLPEEWKDTPESWKRNNPGFKYMFWTDDDNLKLIKTDFPWFLEKYNSYPYPIQRADAIRYFILYKYGGIYSDLDIKCKKPVETLLQMYENNTDCQVLLTSSASIEGFRTNAFMISAKGAEFWTKVFKDMLYYELPFYMIGKHLKVMYTTGPAMITRVNGDWGKKFKVCLIPSLYVHPCDLCNVAVGKTDVRESFVEQVEGNSWHAWDSTIANKVLCTSSTTKYMILFIFILILIFIWVWVALSLKSCEQRNEVCSATLEKTRSACGISPKSNQNPTVSRKKGSFLKWSPKSSSFV